MSSPARRRELARIQEKKDRDREIEERRRAGLSMWERIEESDASWQVKEILHMLAEKLEMEP